MDFFNKLLEVCRILSAHGFVHIGIEADPGIIILRDELSPKTT